MNLERVIEVKKSVVCLLVYFSNRCIILRGSEAEHDHNFRRMSICLFRVLATALAVAKSKLTTSYFASQDIGHSACLTV